MAYIPSAFLSIPAMITEYCGSFHCGNETFDDNVLVGGIPELQVAAVLPQTRYDWWKNCVRMILTAHLLSK